MLHRRFLVSLFAIQLAFASMAYAHPLHAAELPFSVRQAVVKVICGEWQGSGVVVNGEKGYVLTNAHLIVNTETGAQQNFECNVAFLQNDGTTNATVFYSAIPERFVYDESQNRDFAILKIGQPVNQTTIASFPFLKTDEFSKNNDSLSLIGYPGSSKSRLTVTTGTISALEQGIIQTDAVITPGMSGGAGIDANNNLIGLATRILLREVSPGVEEVVHYELVDLRAILLWMDTFGIQMHDTYVTHADPERYHGPTALVIEDRLTCTLLARSPINSTVYCLKSDGTRLVFPNDAVYYSWFSDFSGVQTLQPEELAPFRIASNVTLKPGTLVKIQTDPKVYLVADILGTLRWIPTEEKAVDLFGEGWAGFVKDVPDTFFTNYRIGSPIN
ncbi:MAG: serine protease [Patescibacteria group bacterium]